MVQVLDDLERLLPAVGIYAATCDHCLIFCLRTSMTTGGRTRSRTSPDQQDLDLGPRPRSGPEYQLWSCIS